MKNAKKRAPSISIRWQLMFFIGAMTLLTVGLIWGIITYALAPKYNATIRQNLTNKASAITAIFDQTDSEISSRDFGVLQLDDDFWTALGQTFSDKKINMDGYCVDFSDSTLRCLKAYESMFPCLLHESSGSFSGEFGYNLNTRQLITFRQELFEEGSLYKIVQIGSTRQMLVGQLSADGKYGIIVSTGMAQIATAAEVLRSILWPVALILLVLDLLFAMLLEQLLHVLVIQFCGLNAQSRPWLYYVYAALAAAVFEETGRLIAMKFWMKKWLDFPNALMYGIGHGGVEAILLGGLSGISNLVSMLMINSGAMQNTLAALPAESANQTVSQLSALWTTPAPLFFVSGIERISAIILHIGLSLLIYRAVKAGKCRTAAFTAVLAYGIHFIVDFFAVAGPALLPIYVIEIGVFVMAAGTLVMALKMGRMEEL